MLSWKLTIRVCQDKLSLAATLEVLCVYLLSKASKPQQSDQPDVGRQHELPIRFVQKYEHLVWLSALANNHLVAVEVRQEAIDSQLPPTLRQKKFGVM
jgi:hypothetical protein